jgi:hypothetical protein
MRLSFVTGIACAFVLTVSAPYGAFAQSNGSNGGKSGNRTVHVNGTSFNSRGVRSSSSDIASFFSAGLLTESRQNRNNPARHRAFNAILGLPPGQP